MTVRKLRVDADFYSTVTYRIKTTVHPDHLLDAMTWHMWFDYFSVPQPKATVMETTRCLDLESDLGKAVASLSAYVAACELFLVLAPTILHEDGSLIDFASWKSRGWCRLERFARAMSDQRMPMLLVRQENAVLQLGAQDYLLDSVALGCFSDPDDRPHVNRLVLLLFQHRLQRLLEANRLQEYRRLLCARTTILDGIDVAEFTILSDQFGWIEQDQPSNENKHAMAAANFLRCIHASSHSQRLGGTTPLLLASCAGDVDAMRGLLAQRAIVNSCEKYTDVQFIVNKGRQPLHGAARYGHTKAVELLLNHRADVHARDVLRNTPLHAAVSLGKKRQEATLNLLLERRAEINARNKLGLTALQVAAVFGAREAAKCLLEAGADYNAGPDGLGPAHLIGAFGGVDLCRLLLEANASLDDVFRPRFNSDLGLITGGFSLSFRLGRRSFLSCLGYHTYGASPLAMAAMHGNLLEAQAMLDGRADPEQKNDRGATTKDLARIFGSCEEASAWLFSPKGYVAD